MKTAWSKNTEFDQEKQATFAIASTMKEFYQYIHPENEYVLFDEELVMNRFFDSIREYKDTKWYFRNVVEDAICYKITDEQFAWWIDTYKNKTNQNIETFIERDQTLTRIRLKLHKDDVQSYGDLESIIGWINYAFNSSLKQEVMSLLKSHKLDLSFAEKSERCDVLLSYFKGLMSSLNENVSL